MKVDFENIQFMKNVKLHRTSFPVQYFRFDGSISMINISGAD